MKLRNSMRSIQVGFYKSISWLYFGMMLVIFAICVFCFQMHFGRSEFYQNYIPVFALLPFGIIFVAGLSCVAECAREPMDDNYICNIITDTGVRVIVLLFFYRLGCQDIDIFIA